jgi:uracil-DNA glycosylase
VNDLKVIFVGCNPSLSNTSDQPFVGTKSGKILSDWIRQLDLKESQCGFVNLTDVATRTAASLRKSDIDLGKFSFQLMLKCAEMYHGQPAATNIMVAQMQVRDMLDSQMFAELPSSECQSYLEMAEKTPLPAIVALGTLATWGMSKTNLSFTSLPHPSGLNRKLNDKEELNKLLAKCKQWLYGGGIDSCEVRDETISDKEG